MRGILGRLIVSAIVLVAVGCKYGVGIPMKAYEGPELGAAEVATITQAGTSAWLLRVSSSNGELLYDYDRDLDRLRWEQGIRTWSLGQYPEVKVAVKPGRYWIIYWSACAGPIQPRYRDTYIDHRHSEIGLEAGHTYVVKADCPLWIGDPSAILWIEDRETGKVVGGSKQSFVGAKNDVVHSNPNER